VRFNGWQPSDPSRDEKGLSVVLRGLAGASPKRGSRCAKSQDKQGSVERFAAR
jgi:hypothetical protein